MKRYILFAGDEFYPNGGMGDFVEDFDNKSNALDLIERLKKDFGDWFDWFHVYDTEKMKMVFDESTPCWNVSIEVYKEEKMENKTVFGDSPFFFWDLINPKSWTFSTTEDFVPETIDDFDPRPTIEAEKIKPYTFESLLDQHCQKSDVKVYFRLHEKYKVYKHECNLYFLLKEEVVSVYTRSSLSGNITNTDWLFSFSEPERLKAFLESLPLDQS